VKHSVVSVIPDGQFFGKCIRRGASVNLHLQQQQAKLDVRQAAGRDATRAESRDRLHASFLRYRQRSSLLDVRSASSHWKARSPIGIHQDIGHPRKPGFVAGLAMAAFDLYFACLNVVQLHGW
jgi:hypothetical protein